MSGDMRDIQDPLFARVNNRGERRVEKGRSNDGGGREPAPGRGGSNAPIWILAVCLVVAVAGLSYYIYTTQERIEGLQADLAASQETFEAETEASKEQISTLNEELTSSKTLLGRQQRELGSYKGQVANLKSETDTLRSTQEQQNQNLETIKTQKADRTEVENLEGKTQEIAGRVDEAQGQIGELRDVTGKNRSAIDSNASDITRVSDRADGTAGDLSNLKNSLARDVYNFELEKKGGRMKVLNVDLDLRKTNFKKQHFELEIFVDGRKIKRKNHVNEPVRFYVDGVDKAYEVVITKVGKEFVVGYLSVPKADATKGNSSVSG